MATHSSILAWNIPWTAERGGLQSMGSQSQTQLNMHILKLCIDSEGARNQKTQSIYGNVA